MKVIESLSKEDLKAAELFRALGNPARLRILREIAERKTCVTSELVDVLPLAQSTVSQHLKVLKEAGIVKGEVEGDLCYCIDEGAMEWLSSVCGDIGGCGDSC